MGSKLPEAQESQPEKGSKATDPAGGDKLADEGRSAAYTYTRGDWQTKRDSLTQMLDASGVSLPQQQIKRELKREDGFSLPDKVLDPAELEALSVLEAQRRMLGYRRGAYANFPNADVNPLNGTLSREEVGDRIRALHKIRHERPLGEAEEDEIKTLDGIRRNFDSLKGTWSGEVSMDALAKDLDPNRIIDATVPFSDSAARRTDLDAEFKEMKTKSLEEWGKAIKDGRSPLPEEARQDYAALLIAEQFALMEQRQAKINGSFKNIDVNSADGYLSKGELEASIRKATSPDDYAAQIDLHARYDKIKGLSNDETFRETELSRPDLDKYYDLEKQKLVAEYLDSRFEQIDVSKSGSISESDLNAFMKTVDPSEVKLLKEARERFNHIASLGDQTNNQGRLSRASLKAYQAELIQ